MAKIDDINRAFRDHVRFTGDGLPNEPVGAPLPVGDPRSGGHNIHKADIREAMLTLLMASGDPEALQDILQDLGTKASKEDLAGKASTQDLTAIDAKAEVRQRLLTLFKNGELDAGKDAVFFGELLSANKDEYVDFVPASAALAKYGIKGMNSFPAATSGVPISARLTEDVRLSGGKVFGMILVELASGAWPAEWAGATGPRLVVRTEDGSNPTARLLAFEALSPTLRLYYGEASVPGTTIATRVEVGFTTALPQSGVAYNVGGYWASHTQTSGTLVRKDTAWPMWEMRIAGADTATVRRIAALEKRDSIQRLVARLRDSTRSISFALVGDSNTWGANATGITTINPRGHSLTDVRNRNFDAPTFVNLFSAFLARSFCDGPRQVVNDVSSGLARYEQAITVYPGNDDRFTLVDRQNRSRRTKVNVASSGAYAGQYLNLFTTDGEALEFEFTGEEVTLVYSRQQATGIVIAYQIDGGAVQTANLDGAVAFGQELKLTAPYGNHVVRIWTTGAQGLRIEGFRFKRRVQVRNQGIYGSRTEQWLPTASNGLFAGVLPEDEFVFIMLGTNDNATLPAAVMQANLEIIIAKLIENGKSVILMSPPPELSTDGSFRTWETAVAYDRLAAKFDLPLIDNFRAFMALDPAEVASTYIAGDRVHLTDKGHELIFNNIVETLTLGNVQPDDRAMIDTAINTALLPVQSRTAQLAMLPPLKVDGRDLLVTDITFDRKPLRGIWADTGGDWVYGQTDTDAHQAFQVEVVSASLLNLYVHQTDANYVRWALRHDVNAAKNANGWRLGICSHVRRVGTGYTLVKDVTFDGETDVAILLKQTVGGSNKPDHIGGAFHGNEELTEATLLIDGAVFDPATAELGFRTAGSITLLQASDMFEPGNGDSTVWMPKGPVIMRHYKRLDLDASGWFRQSFHIEHVVGGFQVENAYFGMLCLNGPTREAVVDAAARSPKWLREDVSTSGFPMVLTTADDLAIWGAVYGGEVRMARGWTDPGRKVRVDNRPDRRKVYPNFFQGQITDVGAPWDGEVHYRITIKEA